MNWHLQVPQRARSAIAQFAARSLRKAHETAPGKWGLTPFSDGAMRLNAGFTEVLTADPRSLRVLAIGEALPSNVSRAGVTIHRNGPSYHKSVPGSVLIEVDLSVATKLDALLRDVAAAHESAILLAMRQGVGKGVLEGHRDAAVAHLSELTGAALPLPSRGSGTTPAPSRSSEPQVEEMFEATLRRSTSTRAERNPRARAKCIAYYGCTCRCCGLDFEEAYGRLGRGFIEVHHIAPIAKATGARAVDPVRDLIPVCSNCHRMLHRREPPLTLKELIFNMS